MKAFYFDIIKNNLIPYEAGSKPTEAFWFLYYHIDEVLLTLSIYLSIKHKIDDIDIHNKAIGTILPKNRPPICAGIFSPERRVFDSWFNIWSPIEAPQNFRQTVTNFFINEFKIL